MFKLCSKYKGDFKMVTLLQHLYNKRNKHIILLYKLYTSIRSYPSCPFVVTCASIIGSTLKWSSRLVTNSSKLPFCKDRIHVSPTILVIGHQKNQKYVASTKRCSNIMELVF